MKIKFELWNEENNQMVIKGEIDLPTKIERLVDAATNFLKSNKWK